LASKCYDAFCDPFATIENQCKTIAKQCLLPDNCTIAICYENATLTDSQGRPFLFSGCSNNTINCSKFFIGIIAGLVGGAIAGIVIAAAIVICGAAVGGSAYAISQSQGNNLEHQVRDNPLYKHKGKGQSGLVGDE